MRPNLTKGFLRLTFAQITFVTRKRNTGLYVLRDREGGGADRQTETDRHTDIQTEIDRQTDRQTDGQTETETDRRREREYCQPLDVKQKRTDDRIT